MTEPYRPQVGDTVRLRISTGTKVVEVTAVGRERFLGLFDGFECSYEIDDDWVKDVVPTPLPERWLNIYSNSVGVGYSSREAVDNVRSTSGRLGVIHVHADGVDFIDLRGET
jgi:hypothetical protein